MLYINNDQNYQSDPRGADQSRLLAMAAALVATSTMSIAVQVTVVIDTRNQPRPYPAYTRNTIKSVRFTCKLFEE
jgi:hypothetical protein